MEYHWRPCIQLVPIFWFSIRAFDAYSFEPLPNKSITGHLCMNMRPHRNISKYISFGEYLMEYHWSRCFQFVPTFWFSNKVFVAYFSAPLPNKSITGHLYMNKEPHETFQLHFFLVSFSWSTIEDLAFILCQFFWFPIRAFEAYSFEPLPNKSITGHLCMNLGPHETFQLHFFLVSISWSTIEVLAFNLCLLFGSRIKFSLHIFCTFAK